MAINSEKNTGKKTSARKLGAPFHRSFVKDTTRYKLYLLQSLFLVEVSVLTLSILTLQNKLLVFLKLFIH